MATMEFRSIDELEVKDLDVSKHRHPGGSPRRHIVRGAKEGRLLWYRINVKHRAASKLRDNLTQLEQAAEDLLNLDQQVSYDDLYPVISSFYLVEEAARLYYGDPEDWRYKHFKSNKVKVPFTDVNNVGRTKSGVGRTLKRPFHGDGCNCWICRPDLEQNK